MAEAITSDEPVAQADVPSAWDTTAGDDAKTTAPEPSWTEAADSTVDGTVTDDQQANDETAAEDPAVAPQEPSIEAWAADPAIASSGADAWEAPAAEKSEPVAAAPSEVTPAPAAYTGPPGFNIAATKAQPRTSSRGANRFRQDGEAVVLPAQAQANVDRLGMQFGSLNFGVGDDEGVEAR